MSFFATTCTVWYVVIGGTQKLKESKDFFLVAVAVLPLLKSKGQWHKPKIVFIYEQHMQHDNLNLIELYTRYINIICKYSWSIWHLFLKLFNSSTTWPYGYTVIPVRMQKHTSYCQPLMNNLWTPGDFPCGNSFHGHDAFGNSDTSCNSPKLAFPQISTPKSHVYTPEI